MERQINKIIIHCSATRIDRDFSASDVDSAHRLRGFSCWGYHYYVRKTGIINPMRPEEDVGAHCLGHNGSSIGVCYEGGLDVNGRPADTRTEAQKESLLKLITELLGRYPDAVVLGHRDLSPDINGNGLVDRCEWLKECPCFDARSEYGGIKKGASPGSQDKLTP